MTRFVAIDLADLVATRRLSFDAGLSYEDIVAARIGDFTQRMRNAGVEYDVGNLETDPAVIIQQASGYFELLTRQFAVDVGKAVLLPYARGDDLDFFVARLGVKRLDGEDDARLRTRYLLALEAFSTAGPVGAYVFHAMTASNEVKDVAVYGPESSLVDPGQVGVYLLSRVNSGAASEGLCSLVRAACGAEDVRPLTDQVIVQTAEIVPYDIEVKLLVGFGPDPTPFVEAARARLLTYVERRHRIGATVTLAGLSGAAHVDGVEDAVIVSPSVAISTTATQAPWASSLSVTWERVSV